MPIPIIANMIASIAMTAANITTATTAITNAFIHPQSKKCLIIASQTISNIIAAIKLPMNAPTTVFMMVPRKTIQSPSVNFALSFPQLVFQKCKECQFHNGAQIPQLHLP